MFSIILTALVLLFILSIGLIVLKNNTKSLTNISFFWVTVFLVLWGIANFLENGEFLSLTARSSYLEIDFFLGPLVCFFWILFCRVFLSDINKLKEVTYKFISFIPVVFFSPLAFTDLIIKNIKLTPAGINFDFGIMFIPYALLIFGYLFGGLYILLKKYKGFTGLKKIQTLYVLLGLSISATITLLINLVLQNYISVEITRVGIYGFIFIIAFTSYAILKYRLMDVRVIIRRSAVFTVLILVITALYAVLSYLLSLVFTELIGIQSVILNGIVMAVLVAIGFEPLKKGLSEVTDSFLFKAEYKPQEVLGEYSEKLSSTLDLNELTSFLVKKTSEVFKCTKTSLYLFNVEHKEYQEVAMWGKRSPVPMKNIDQKLFAKIFSYLKQIGKAKDIIVREEIKKINEQFKNPALDLLTKQLDEREVNLVVPFYVKEELIGILFLGDKKSGDVYSQQDLNVLEIIAGQSAVSIQNAGLYEEQKHFTEHLKREVEKATKELKIANIQLRKLDKAKSEFISIASHQLRTPLTVIKGYLSMIDQGDFGTVTEKIKLPLDRVYKSTLRIIGLVEDLLNISRIESGRLKYDFVKADLSEIVEDVVDELKQNAVRKNLLLEYEKPKVKLPQILLDQSKVREVIMNLLDNAIKYTDSGFVKAKLEKTDHNVRFSVTDSGRGLEPDEIPLLFQKFSRAKGAQLMHTEGTGLGLYIAKNILHKHHAKIWVESPGKDKGSTFIIEFKLSNK